MKERKLSVRKLALASELDPSTIQRILGGITQPLPDTIVSLAEGLQVHPNELFRWYDDFAKQNQQ